MDQEMELGRKRGIMGKAIIAIGAIVLVIGLLGIPPIADLLSVSLNSLLGDSHTTYRIVPTAQSSSLVSAFLIATSLLLCGAGLALHRRRKRD
jgi:hypothetical protein